MASLKPIKIYKSGPSPNPWKVAIILEELGLPYELVQTPFSEIKKEPFISLNPNGRLPAMIDPNRDDITLFESGAIIDYLVDVYDEDAKLHYTSFREKYLTRSWEHFQMSGQGPYFGQKGWFVLFHPEKVQSAIDRYDGEIRRVIGVVDAHLAKQGTPYLVGDRITYADLMFITWFRLAEDPVMSPDLDTTQWPRYRAWLDGMVARPAVARVLARQDEDRQALNKERAGSAAEAAK
ncbi:Glutathione-s-transferase theta, gst [Pleurostoma richardsiae]|uniref:Glutathione-s-transferase theta, gst n=1 Tax=Pleurostoma richardsiae TaxID=41990 RepID=A0AA38VS02_9PEZI|nr:Glutathione-s-transferase theta, gst [Pleurostoma richardsiae]